MLFFSNDGHRLATRAAREARALGLSFVGPDHFLLALVHPDEDTPASRVLKAGTVGYAKARARVAALTAPPSSTDNDEEASRWLRLNLASHHVVGRAEGLAAGLDAGAVTAEHLLLALLWDRDRHIAFLLEEIGMERHAVLREMRRQAIKTPDGELPSVWVPREVACDDQ